jgi:hypothetical protein
MKRLSGLGAKQPARPPALAPAGEATPADRRERGWKLPRHESGQQIEAGLASVLARAREYRRERREERPVNREERPVKQSSPPQICRAEL